jgi:hypothetical protein
MRVFSFDIPITNDVMIWVVSLSLDVNLAACQLIRKPVHEFPSE